MMARISVLLGMHVCLTTTAGLAAVINYRATASCAGTFIAGQAEGIPIFAPVNNSGVSTCTLTEPNAEYFSFSIGTTLHKLEDGVGATMWWGYGPPYGFAGGVEGATSLDVTWRFTSGGAPREGIAFLSLGTSAYGTSPFPGTFQRVTVTDGAGRSYTFAGTCWHECHWNYDPHYSSPPAVPFQLGAPFEIRVQLSGALRPTIPDGELYGAERGANAQLWLREEDGSTAVSISDVPEPKMVLPMSGALALIWLARRAGGTQRNVRL
jgi:hypothetical protein